MRLYELPEAVRLIEAMLDGTDGEVTPEIQAAMDAVEGEQAAKIDWYGGLIAEASREADAIKAESERLAERAKVLANRATNMKLYVFNAMDAMGETKIKGKLFTASVCKNSQPSIKWEGQGDIPRGFQRIRVELDGDAAREAFKAGMLPAGFNAVVGRHLRIG